MQKKFFNLLKSMMMIPLAVMAINCSGSSTSTSAADTGDDASVALTDLSSLPQATGPVVSDSDASLSSYLARSKPSFATTGMNMVDTSEDDFTTDSSYAACEMFNHTREAMRGAAQADMILCFVQAMAGAIEGDIYDGEYHVLALDTSGFGEGDDSTMAGAPEKVRMRITKDENGNITNFEMNACQDGATKEYVSQTIDPATGEFTMNSKNMGEGGEGEYRYEIQVAATLNADGEFAGEKNITVLYSSESQYSITNFTQTSSLMTADSISVYSGEWDGHTFTSLSQVQAAAELLDENVAGEEYDIGLVAMGDGAVKWGYSSEDEEGNELWSENGTEGWNGDTILVDSEVAADYIAMVTDAVLSENTTEPTIAFESGEDYDCSDEAEGTIDMAEQEENVLNQCSDLMQIDGQWIDCWNTIQSDDFE